MANPVGAPTVYNPAILPRIKELARDGATDREIAEFIGVSVNTVYRWKAANREFRYALRMGRKSADLRVKRALYQRAIGYSVETVKVFCNKEGEVTQVPIIEHYPPSEAAAIFWLKNRKSDEWRDKQDHTLTGEDGGPVKFVLERIGKKE